MSIPLVRHLRAPVAVAAIALSGCGGLIATLPFTTPDTSSAQKTHTLRYRREVGGIDRYQAKYRVRGRNDLRVDEDVTAQLLYYYTGKTAGPESFDRVVIRRMEVKRSHVETAPNGKVVRKDRPRNFQPEVTPNSEAEPGTRYRYIPFDELGRIGRLTNWPYHYVWYDSLCYFFPVFPTGAVSVGDEWSYQTPVIVDTKFSNNVLKLHARFRLSDVRRLGLAGGGEGPLCAVIEYTYYGLLNTDHERDASKLPGEPTGLLWFRNVFEGAGLVYFDIERGKVAWKRERYRVIIERKVSLPDRGAAGGGSSEAGKKGKDSFFAPEFARSERKSRSGVDHYCSVNSVEFAARLLSPAESASDRPSRSR